MLFQLPIEIGEKVISCVDWRDLIRLSQTCKFLHSYLNQKIDQFPDLRDDVVNAGHKYIYPNLMNWKEGLDIQIKPGIPKVVANVKQRDKILGECICEIEDSLWLHNVDLQALSTKLDLLLETNIANLYSGSFKLRVLYNACLRNLEEQEVELTLQILDLLYTKRIFFKENCIHYHQIPENPVVLQKLIDCGMAVHLYWDCTGKECEEAVVQWYLEHENWECVKVLVRNGIDRNMVACMYDDRPIFDGIHWKYEDFL